MSRTYIILCNEIRPGPPGPEPLPLTKPPGCAIMFPARPGGGRYGQVTKKRIFKNARKAVRGEKLADFLNDPKQYFHRVRVGYYHDRYVFACRWLINEEQQQIDDYYIKQQQT